MMFSSPFMFNTGVNHHMNGGKTPVPALPTTATRPLFMELLEKLRDEHNNLKQQYSTVRTELEQTQNKNHVQGPLMMHQEMDKAMKLEIAKYSEVNRRIHNLLTQVISMLPPDQQPVAVVNLERAKEHSPQELMMLPQMMGPLSGMSGIHGMPMGLPMPPPMVPTPIEKRQQSESPAFKRPKFENELEIDVKSDGASDSNNSSPEFVKNLNSRECSSSPPSVGHVQPRRSPLAQIQAGMFPMSNPMAANNPMAAWQRGMMTPQMQQMLMGTNMMNARCSSYKMTDVGYQPTTFPPEVYNLAGMPRTIKRLHDLDHGTPVSAVTINRDGRRVYTGGKGCVKVWDIGNRENAYRGLISTLECFKEQYIRSCKLLAEDKHLIAGGESSTICMWDLEKEIIMAEFDHESQACYCLTTSLDQKLLFLGGTDGNVTVWDLHNQHKIAVLSGHGDGVSCIDRSFDGNKLWTGGLDSTVRIWDLREQRQEKHISFPSQIYSLACSPNEDWVAAGMENHTVEIMSSTNPDKYQLRQHEASVLGLKFASSGKWFISAGKDNTLNGWRTPYGANLFNVKDTSSVLSCDISFDDSLIVTGSGERTTVYEVVFQ